MIRSDRGGNRDGEKAPKAISNPRACAGWVVIGIVRERLAQDDAGMVSSSTLPRTSRQPRRWTEWASHHRVLSSSEASGLSRLAAARMQKTAQPSRESIPPRRRSPGVCGDALAAAPTTRPKFVKKRPRLSRDDGPAESVLRAKRPPENGRSRKSWRTRPRLLPRPRAD